MVIDDKVKKVEDNSFKPEISKDDIVVEYLSENETEPTWKDKKQKDMDEEEKKEYKKYRERVNKKIKNVEEVEEVKEEIQEPVKEEVKEKQPQTSTKKATTKKATTKKGKEKQKGFYDDNKELSIVEPSITEDEVKTIISTGAEAREAMLTDEQKEELSKMDKEDKFIAGYIKHHNIEKQEEFNYAIEHDEKFRVFLKKTGRLGSLYTGKHLNEIESEKEKIIEQYKQDAQKDKKGKVAKKFKKFKKQSNVFGEAKKDLDLTPYKNKKLESQGSILTMYLRKNGLAQLRYVKMDEVGQIKVEGYVYHERDAVYRFGKKNDPLLIIMEGALVPINKETLKENLGCETAEAQKLVIKGIEQAEVVKSSGIDENAKKPFAPPKWLIIGGIAVAIGIYMFMGGSS